MKRKKKRRGETESEELKRVKRLNVNKEKRIIERIKKRKKRKRGKKKQTNKERMNE
jgi:hypothetical protein